MVNVADKRKVAKYIENKEVMPKIQAAMKAGYSENYARTPQVIEQSQTYQEMLAEYIPKKKLLKTLTDGLEAVKVSRVGFGEKMDTFHDIDYGTRHKYTETAMKLHGMFEIDNKQKAPSVNIDLGRLTDEELRIRAEIDDKAIVVET